jgi:hypothetical protein
MIDINCETCKHSEVPHYLMPCAVCNAEIGLWEPHATHLQTPDENRIDQIGQNGNDGLHYTPTPSPTHQE